MQNKYWRWIVLTLTLSGAAVAARASDLADEEWVLLKIHSTRTLTAHLSLGYDMGSIDKMAKRITPGDVPALIRLYNKDKVKYVDKYGTGLAIASQCGAGLAGLANMTRIDDATEIAKQIAASRLCTASDRDAAKEKIADLEVQRIARDELERRERARIKMESEAKFLKQQQAWHDEADRRVRSQRPQSETNIPAETH